MFICAFHGSQCRKVIRKCANLVLIGVRADMHPSIRSSGLTPGSPILYMNDRCCCRQSKHISEDRKDG